MNLKTKYMGLELKNPIVPSASPLTTNVDNVKAMEDNGAAAVVMHSLFEEQLTHESGELDHYLSHGTESYAEATSFFPQPEEFRLGPFEYLDQIANLKKAVNIPIIGSINGVSKGGWTDYARNIEEAGADALELNVYYIPTNSKISSEEVENMYVETLKSIKDNVKIPVALKLSPYFTSMSNMANKLSDAGADALVMFNRFYQPDFNLEKLEVEPNLVLSTNWEMRLPLRWIAILYGQIASSMALTSGVQNYEDVLKGLMAGADITMLCSEILRNGVGRIGEIISNLTKWMEENEYDSIDLMKGSMSQKSVGEPAAFERANYMKALNTYKVLS